MARGVVGRPLQLADVCLVQMGEEWLLFLTGIAAPLSLVVEPEKKTPSVGLWFGAIHT